MARRRINPADISAQSAVGKVRGSRRAALSALLAALALLALAPPALAQVSFSGPTNYPVGLTPYAAAVARGRAGSGRDTSTTEPPRTSGSVKVATPDGEVGFATVRRRRPAPPTTAAISSRRSIWRSR